MKNLLRYLAFVLIILDAFAQSNLPSCPTSGYLHNCIGSYTYPSGNTYVGEFRADKRDGLGTFYSSNGSVISKGIWSFDNLVRPAPVQQATAISQPTVSTLVPSNKIQSNLPSCPPSGYLSYCFGTYVYPSGNKYVGEFKSDKRDGLGIFYDVSGSVINQGIWSFDSFVRSAQAPRETAQITSETELARVNNSQQQRPTQLTSQEKQLLENEKLREEAAVARQRQRELEEQLRQVQQGSSIPTQTASIGTIGRRIALVVGNANYKVRPLKNSRNDADDVSRSLKATGFDVIDLRDATLPQMRTAVRQFGDRLINNDVGLVYYSGHGVEVKGRNYFIPVTADIQREDEIADQGLDVSLILEKMNTAGKGVNILIVDACRDDPFGRSFRSSSRGLAQMDAPRGTIIAYATSPGKVASDGDPRERNSPYTKHLVKAMQSPNKPIEQVFKEVRRAVQDETKNQQTPWENTSLSGDFFFRVQR